MTIKRGVYRHFKGNLYFVHETAIDAESDSPREVVIYEPLYGEPNRRFVRSVENFRETVNRPELGYEGPRFYPVYS